MDDNFEAHRTVLVVDDVLDNVKLLRYDLEDEGYTVYTASSGMECLAKAEELLPDIILLDIFMPDMDGYETCRRLKADKNLKDVPVILVSAKDLHENVVKGLDAGAQDFVAKPFQFPVVAARVRSQLRTKQVQDQLKQSNAQLLDARRTAIALADQKEIFFASMSHEIRTPMTGVVGMVELLADTRLNKQQREFLDAIRVSADSLLMLVDDILAHSKMDMGKLELNNFAYEPRSLVDNVRKMLGVVALNKG
ncbi:MAG: response regulator, partial [Pseudomonadales bacterium]|nr:response regulator [Pseudomonadales bacterium]